LTGQCSFTEYGSGLPLCDDDVLVVELDDVEVVVDVRVE